MEISDKRIHEKMPSPYLTGLLCRCPRCGKGKLFDGFLTLKPKCDACGLDFSFADAGDGPAIFVIMIAGAIVVGSRPGHRGQISTSVLGPRGAVDPVDPDRDALAVARAEKSSHRVAISSQGIVRPAPSASRRLAAYLSHTATQFDLVA